MRLSNLIPAAALLACATAAAQTAPTPAWPAIDESSRRQALLSTQLEELSLQRQVQQMKLEVEHGSLNDMPVLVGVTLGRDGHVAEFALPRGIQKAAEGEAIGGGWSVRRIDGRNVELVHVREGRATPYHAVIGSTPTPAARR